MSQSRDSLPSQSASADPHGPRTQPPIASAAPPPPSARVDPEPQPSDSAHPREESNDSIDTRDNVQLKLPKRRRITRACDDCRRKKIKCDGKQPCSSCAEFNSGCTYSVPSRRSKAPVPQSRDPEVLEARLQVAESLIRRFLPQINLQTLQYTVSSPQLSSRGDESREDAARPDDGSQLGPSTEADRYIPMVENEDHLRFTDSGELDFHGHSSGAAFLSHFTQHFPELLRYDSRIPFLPQAPRLGGLPTVLPTPSPISTGHSKYDFSKLPPRELARILCQYSFNHASCMLRIVHVPSFYAKFDILYDAQKSSYDQEESRYVGLLYSVLALGSMYDVDENDPSNPDHYNEAMNRGHKFYLGARLYLQDLTECRDMTRLQALLFIIQFLQAIGNLNSCYNLIGIALRSALRMGLHRHLPNLRMTPIESEIRKRVFHTIRQMDIYLSTTLGLPVVLQARDIDQPLPIAVDDEYITEHTLFYPPDGTPSMIQAFNAHDNLMEILVAVVEFVYSPRAANRKGTQGTYLIDVGQLRQVEHNLEQWYQKLPVTLRPGQEYGSQEQDIQLTRVQILLRFAYAHVQMMLYRPFMQFYSHQKSPEDERHRSYAAAGIIVCRNIIHIGVEIRKQAVLIGSYWFILYTQFLAVLCLIFYVFRNPDSPESSGILSDAVLGKESISGLAQRSLAADRLSAVLNSVFEQLPQRLSSRIQNISTSSRAQSAEADPVIAYRSEPTAARPFTEQRQHQWRMAAARDTSSRTMSPATGPVMFSTEGPIAYPHVSGTVAKDSVLGSSNDTMQLVIPDLFENISGQVPQVHEPIEPGQDFALSSMPAPFPLNDSDILDGSIDDIFKGFL